MNVSQEFSKSMDQLCYQLSFANVTIVPLKDCGNVSEFIANFELATAGLSEEQKVPLLAKGFPAGKYRYWYENNLQPLIKERRSWQEAKRIIIERFTEPKDQDRHFKKLREMSFNPDGGQSLIEFVDELTHAYKKACLDQGNNDALLIKHIKASLPTPVVTALSVYSNYRDATTLKELNQAIRDYDALQKLSPKKTTNEGDLSSITAMFQQFITGMRQEQEATRNSIVSALKDDRHYQYTSRDQVRRDKSPYRSNSYDRRMQRPQHAESYEGQSPRPKSPNYQRRDYNWRSPHGSPSRSQRLFRPPTPHTSEEKWSGRPAFNAKAYYERFGKPESACDVCGDMHHSRHCPMTLN